MLEEFAIVYPNIESLHLKRYDNGVNQSDDECLSSIQFSKLTSLSLEGFNVNGSFLPQVKLEQKSDYFNVYISYIFFLYEL